MTAPFSIKESFKTGWRLLRAHSGLVFAVVLTLLAVQVAQSVVDNVLKDEPIGFLAGIVLGVANAVLGVGATVISLRLAEGKSAEYRDLIPLWGVFLRFMLSGLLVVLIVCVPILVGGILATVSLFALAGDSLNLLEGVAGASIPMGAIIPAAIFAGVGLGVGVYMALRYSMVRYSIVDGAKVVESLRTSWRLTRGAMGRLALFVLAVIGVNILGALLFMVGLLITLPLSMLALAHVYLKLRHRHAA